jgi:hypothetical protein
MMDLMESWEATKLEFNPAEDDYSTTGTRVRTHPHKHMRS